VTQVKHPFNVYGQTNVGAMMVESKQKNPVAKQLRTPKFKSRVIRDKRRRKREIEDEQYIKQFWKNYTI